MCTFRLCLQWRRRPANESKTVTSQATPQLLEERRRVAKKELPELLKELTQRYVRSIKAYNPNYDPSQDDLAKITSEVEKMIRNSVSGT